MAQKTIRSAPTFERGGTPGVTDCVERAAGLRRLEFRPAATRRFSNARPTFGAHRPLLTLPAAGLTRAGFLLGTGSHTRRGSSAFRLCPTRALCCSDPLARFRRHLPPPASLRRRRSGSCLSTPVCPTRALRGCHPLPRFRGEGSLAASGDRCASGSSCATGGFSPEHASESCLQRGYLLLEGESLFDDFNGMFPERLGL